jgi:AraC family transcriptional regulator
MSVDFAFISQQLNGSAECAFLQPDHIIVVYRGGGVQTKEYELENGQSRQVERPQRGNVWVLPAEQRGAALARGNTTADFCQLTVPTSSLGSRGVRPTVGRDPLLYQLIERMNSVIDRDDVVARLLQESLTETVRLHLSDYYTPTAAKPRRSTPSVLDATIQAQLTEFLADSLDSKISLATLAQLAGMSVNGFTRAFAAAFHSTPHQYVLDRRISRAKTLLTQTMLPITEITMAVGFSTPSHFATAFKSRVGVTPSEYRRELTR